MRMKQKTESNPDEHNLSKITKSNSTIHRPISTITTKSKRVVPIWKRHYSSPRT